MKPICSTTLATSNLSVQLIPVPGVTRVNTTRFDPRTGTTTHQRTSGFEVAETDVVELIRSLDRLIERGDYVVYRRERPPFFTELLLNDAGSVVAS
jgi:fructose-1-phosphate kinase PfkB-like protein